MRSLRDLPEGELKNALAYAGLVLVGYELVKSMIVGPIKAFYDRSTFAEGMFFKTYAEDVGLRQGDELEKCLSYLKDFMHAIESEDVEAIQEFRRHRNDIAHDLVDRLPNFPIADRRELFLSVDRTLFKLSNYWLRMEVGADPEFQDVEWSTAKGHEYLLFEHVVQEVGLLSIPR